MHGLFLLCCVEILGTLLCGAQHLTASPAADSQDGADQDETIPTSPPRVSSSKPGASSLMNTQSPTRITRFSGGPSASPSAESQLTSLLDGFLYRKECIPVLLVSGGLIIVCSILLVSTLLLAWKVYQLSQHIKALTNGTGLISDSEYWMGTAKSKKSKSVAEPEETGVLMEDCSKRQEEAGNGATTEEGEAVSESNKEKAEDTANCEDVSTNPAATSESASCSKQLEAATSFTEAGAPTPQGAQETKETMRDELE